MAERAGAAIDVDLVMADADVLERRHRDDGEAQDVDGAHPARNNFV